MASKISDAERQSRFWSRAIPSEDGCWKWSGGKTGNGYGAIWLNGRNIGAHCYAWMVTHGPIPENMVVCHRCDKPLCVNPSHLFIGTLLDNIRDRDTKGRQWKGPKLNRERIARGERNAGAKLSEPQVRAILSSREAAHLLASCYGVSKSAIDRIREGRTWKHLHDAIESPRPLD